MGNNLAANIVKGINQRITRPFQNPYKKIGFSLFKVKLIKNLPAKKLQSITLFNKKITFFSREEFSSNLEEIFIEEIYKQQLPDNAVIIDCGANIGLSVIYLKMRFPQAVIVAYEPDDFNFKILQKNIESYGFKNIELRKEAVWIENTRLNFLNKGSLSSRITDDADKNGMEIIAIRLKDILKENIDFLKIDIEGAEYQVIKDIGPNLHFVKNIFIEYHGRFNQNTELNEILQIITENGFQYYIKEAINKYPTPFLRQPSPDYDVQLNIFCFRL